MDEKRKKRISKYLSKILRHDPRRIGLEVETGGWINLAELFSAFERHDVKIRPEELFEVVELGRYRIRASYGHSIPVDLGLTPRRPPDILYHGTAEQFLLSIEEEGIRAMKRRFVHLYEDSEAALDVGRRHGKPYLLTIDAAAMQRDGYLFYPAYIARGGRRDALGRGRCEQVQGSAGPENKRGSGIWLTEWVPPDYLPGGV